MTMILDGTQGITFPDTSKQYNSYYSFKNRIINGAMVIDQRNNGASFTPAGGGYGCDRWKFELSQASKLTAQRSTTAPTGFINSQLITSSSAYSVLTGDYFAVGQLIEGLNVSDLAWGTASASAVTLSFWVRSSLTGTFGGALSNSAQNRSYPFTYTISSANTYEQKTVTIAGDTSGTWLTDTGVGLRVYFGLGAGATYSGTAGAWGAAAYVTATGSTSVVGTNGATFYITGVQLEKGTQATSFDYRPYTTEEQLCQRYYWRLKTASANARTGNGFNLSTTTGTYVYPLPVSMRAAPSALEQSGTAGHYGICYLAVNTAGTSVPTFVDATTNTATVGQVVAAVLTAGQGSQHQFISTSAYLGWSAEL